MSNAVSTQVSGDIESFRKQCQVALQSRMLPQGISTVEQAMVIALKGKEIGIPMMQAFSHIHVISGKPTVSAELMLALIFRNCPGAQVHYIETSSKACTLEASRPGGKPSKFSFTIEDAQSAGLLNNPTWKKYPSAMLRARAISTMARALFPDAIMGCSYTPEELGAPVAVQDDGSVTVEATARIVGEEPGENDGHAPNPTHYRVPGGTYARYSLKELDGKEVLDYITRLEKQIASGKKVKPEWWDEFVERAQDYYASLENGELDAGE